jgi:hypothetical protein
VYCIYYQNVFIKTSTWLTTIIAVGRYLGICHPLHFRRCARLAFTKGAIAATFMFWILVKLPLMWSYDIHTVPVDNDTYIYYIDVGYFQQNENFKMTLTYIWAILGYFIPLAILAFCNYQLVKALRRSQRLRQTNARYCNASAHDHRSRITVTLIALTSMYILLVSPSEILHFYMDTADTTATHHLERAVVCTNVLQVINFSCHFVLYCIVNSTFRSIIINTFKWRCKGTDHLQGTYSLTRDLRISFSTRSHLVVDCSNIHHSVVNGQSMVLQENAQTSPFILRAHSQGQQSCIEIDNCNKNESLLVCQTTDI